MKAITRQPKLLVKMSAGPQRLTLAAGKSKFTLQAEPLFESIKDKPRLGLAAAPQWQMVTATDETDEVNGWELCHHMMTGGLGLAGGTARPWLPCRVATFLDGRRLRRCDASSRDEGVEVRGVDAHVLAELGEGDAPLGDEPADEPRRRPETGRPPDRR